MPPLPESILRVLAPLAPLFSQRVWLHAQTLLVGALLAPGRHTVTAALRAVGLAAARHFTNDQSDAVGSPDDLPGASRGAHGPGSR